MSKIIRLYIFGKMEKNIFFANSCFLKMIKKVGNLHKVKGVIRNIPIKVSTTSMIRKINLLITFSIVLYDVQYSFES